MSSGEVVPPLWMAGREREGMEPARPNFCRLNTQFPSLDSKSAEKSADLGALEYLGRDVSALLSLRCLLRASARVPGLSCGYRLSVPWKSPPVVVDALHAPNGTCSAFVTAGGPTDDGSLDAWCWRKGGQGQRDCRVVRLFFPVLWTAVTIPPAENLSCRAVPVFVILAGVLGVIESAPGESVSLKEPSLNSALAWDPVGT